MPRKRIEDQRYGGHYGTRKYNQWPGPSIWGRRKVTRDGIDPHPFQETAVDNWYSKRVCAPECQDCMNRRRVRRIRRMYRGGR